jgi:hypothetical protein
MISTTHIFILSSIFLYILFGPCSCKCKKNETVILIDAETKDYTLYQPNSFWIYEHHPSGIKDTQKIHQIDRWTDQFEFCLPTKELIQISSYSSIARDSFFYEITPENDFGKYYSNYAKSVDTAIRRTISLYFSGRLNDSLKELRSPSYSSIKLKEIFSTYQSAGFNFRDVKVFERSFPYSITSDSLRKIFWARGVGIIRKEYASGSYEELIGYSVKQ